MTTLTPTVEPFFEIRTNGNNTTYGQALTHRYVSGELRFLTLALGNGIHEFRLPAPGQTQTATTGRWSMVAGVMSDHNGIWFEEAKNRLWVTSSQDYTVVNNPAKVSLLQLNADGTTTLLKQFFLNVPSKRVYGGAQKVPASLVAQLGGEYVVGWGGYTSLVAQGGGASIGPTMYAIPAPDTITNGATVAARTILDTVTSRGLRKTIPQNYFDGGDARQNPSTRPTVPPLTSGQWLSPNAQGLGWMTWGDSYYNTGAWVGDVFVSLASLGKGACWYQSSTLHFDGRQFEVHQWDGTGLGADPLKRPDRMDEVLLPDGSSRMWPGNTPTGNIAGATFDATTGIYWAYGAPFSTDDYTARLYPIRLTVGAPVPPPPPPPDPVPDPTPDPVPDPTPDPEPDPTPDPVPDPVPDPTPDPTPVPCSCNLAPIQASLDRIEGALLVQTIDAKVAGTPTRYSNGDYRIVLRVQASALTAAPASGSTVKVVK